MTVIFVVGRGETFSGGAAFPRAETSARNKIGREDNRSLQTYGYSSLPQGNQPSATCHVEEMIIFETSQLEYREVDLDAIAKQTANEGYIYKIK